MKIKPHKFLGIALLVILLLGVVAVIARVNILLIIPIFGALVASAYQYAAFLQRRNKLQAVKEMRDLFLEHRWKESQSEL